MVPNALSPSLRRILGILAVLAVCLLATAADDKPLTEGPKKATGPLLVEVRFTDNSTLKLTMLDEKLDFVTPYGKLAIPVADIQQIDVATRISPDVTKKVEKAIADLGNSEFKVREAASVELLKVGDKAYPALVEAAKSNDAEVKRRAEALLDRIKQTMPADMLKVRKNDVITTENSKFTGTIEGSILKVSTTQFGDVPLKLSDVRSIALPGKKKEGVAAVNVQPDPGSLDNFANQFGMVFYFRVTGANNGSVWGSDVYTTDSSLAMAAVHAGAVKVGETGVVKVTIVVPPASFEGTARNGITTSPWNAYPSAYTVAKPDAE